MTRVTKAQARNDRSVELLVRHHELGEYSEMLKVASGLISKRGEYSLLGLQYMGLGHFLQAQYPEALPYFQRAARKSGSRTDHFNLLLCAVYLRDSRLEDSMLRKMQESLAWNLSSPPGRNSPTDGQFRMYYCETLLETGRIADAEAQFRLLLGIYARLQDIDDRYCRLNNLPSLLSFVEVAQAIFRQQDYGEDIWNQWIDRISASVRAASVDWQGLKKIS